MGTAHPGSPSSPRVYPVLFSRGAKIPPAQTLRWGTLASSSFSSSSSWDAASCRGNAASQPHTQQELVQLPILTTAWGSHPGGFPGGPWRQQSPPTHRPPWTCPAPFLPPLPKSQFAPLCPFSCLPPSSPLPCSCSWMSVPWSRIRDELCSPALRTWGRLQSLPSFAGLSPTSNLPSLPPRSFPQRGPTSNAFSPGTFAPCPLHSLSPQHPPPCQAAVARSRAPSRGHCLSPLSARGCKTLSVPGRRSGTRTS